MKSKDFKKYLLLALDILKLDKKAIKKVAKDKEACKWGVLFMVIAGLAGAIGIFNPLMLIWMPISYIISFSIAIAIFWLFARMFGGKAKLVEQYRAQSIGIVGYWVGVIPFIGPMLLWLIEIWYLVISVKIIEELHGISRAKAILSVVLPAVIIFVIMIVIVMTFMAGEFSSDFVIPEIQLY